MNDRLLTLDTPLRNRPRARTGRLDRLARRLILSRLDALADGRITVTDGGHRHVFGKTTPACELSAELIVHDDRFWGDMAFGGSIGAAEAFMRGYWTTDDLTALLRIMLVNRDTLDRMDGGFAVLSKPLRKLLHVLNRNTRHGSRRNIAAHYDLGNDFYSLWLDPTMMYSCAWYESLDTSLEEASVAKLDRICRKLALSPDDRVMEIGTGWGGFAIHAARNYGCHVTTTTISREQHDYAKQAIRDAGLEDRITLLFRDYRDLEGRFDKLVSIEMIEAVGHEYQAQFFSKCCELLEPHGQMLLQAITIADQRFDSYKNSVDFIKRYIFPGGCLTSVTAMNNLLTRHTDMRAVHIEDIGPHYATTLRDWRERFFANLEAVRSLGYPDEFVRMWDFYLSSCESAFIERAIGDVQMLIMRPGARPVTFAG